MMMGKGSCCDNDIMMICSQGIGGTTKPNNYVLDLCQ